MRISKVKELGLAKLCLADKLLCSESYYYTQLHKTEYWTITVSIHGIMNYKVIIKTLLNRFFVVNQVSWEFQMFDSHEEGFKNTYLQ